MSDPAPVPHRRTSVRVAGAGLWLVAGRLGAKVVDFVALIVLAGLLTPADFGLVAMAMTVILLVEAVLDMPLTQSIVRAETPGAADYDTAFTLGLLRSGVLCAIVLGVAWPAAAFYGEPRLPLLLCALMLAPLLRGAQSPRLADYMRRYDMRPSFVNELAGKVCALAAVAILALATRSYWAIAAGTIITPMVMVALSYVWAPYRPRLDLGRWREFHDIVGWNSLTQLISALSWHIDRILLGRVLPLGALGGYTLSKDLIGIPFQAILYPVASPLLNAFARASDAEARRRTWIKSLNAAMFVMGPLLTGMAILSAPAIHTLLGSEWAQAAPYMSALAVTALPGAVTPLLSPLAIAAYRTRMVTIRTLAEFAIKLPLTILGVWHWGVWGAILAQAAATGAGAVYVLFGARSLTGAPVLGQILSMWRTLAGVAVLAGVTLLLCPSVAAAGEGWRDRAVLGLLTGLTFAAGLAGHVATCLLLWRVSGRPAGVESLLLDALGVVVRKAGWGAPVRSA